MEQQILSIEQNWSLLKGRTVEPRQQVNQEEQQVNQEQQRATQAAGQGTEEERCVLPTKLLSVSVTKKGRITNFPTNLIIKAKKQSGHIPILSKWWMVGVTGFH